MYTAPAEFGYERIALRFASSNLLAAQEFLQLRCPINCTSFLNLGNFLSRPEVKIINNSWGTSTYLLQRDVQEDASLKDDPAFQIPYEGFLQATRADKLLIFAAGNSGHADVCIEGNLDYLSRDESAHSLSTNLITVTAANSANIVRKDDESLSTNSHSIAIFSDLAMFDEDSALSAPGFLLNSSNADFASDGQHYIEMSGTSMAAPIVTGVGALVQEAFPYLGGKQIGDVLLSTANNNMENADGFYLTAQEDYLEDITSSETKHSINIFFGNDKSNDAQKQKIDALTTYLKQIVHDDVGSLQNKEFQYFVSSLTGESQEAFEDVYETLKQASPDQLGDAIQKVLTRYEIDLNAYYNTPHEMIFGQGIVDAAAAVKGPGAINVRRLSRADISEHYTVAGRQAKQALYAVDTKGYDSVWRNDMKEIRAGYLAANPLTGAQGAATPDDLLGLEDLQKRYQYYYDNFVKKANAQAPDDKKAQRVNDFIKYYNKKAENSALVGLHAGLIKTGAGILALSGHNTFKGSSIVKEGVLQIDGSIAGDAHGEGSGTIAGSGTIEGSLYNQANVVAGSLLSYSEQDEPDQSLQIKENFLGTGTITIHVYDNLVGQLIVGGRADIGQMEIKLGAVATPDIEGTFISAADGLEDGLESLDNLTGFLDAELKYQNNRGTIKTFADNNTGGNDRTFGAIKVLYDALAPDDKKQMHALYALPARQAGVALEQLKGGLHLDLAHDALQNKDVREAMRVQGNVARQNCLWATVARTWYDPGSLNGQSYSVILGKDFVQTHDYYAGAFFSYSDNTVSGANGKGQYDNYGAALYVVTQNNPQTLSAYLSYSFQNNDVKRLAEAAGEHQFGSDYHSRAVGAGVKYGYDLHYNKQAKLHVIPYAQTDFTHFKSEGFVEQGTLYGLKAEAFRDNYWSGTLGLALQGKGEVGTFGGWLGFERVFSGVQQRFSYRFANATNAPLDKAESQKVGRNKVILGAYADIELSNSWAVSAHFNKQWGDHDRALSAQVNASYRF